MRAKVLVIAVAVLSTSLGARTPLAGQQKPDPQPVFRAGVDLVSVDVTAVDNNGRQVTDLTAADFQVDVDGDRRQVATIEYVRLSDPLRAVGAPAKVTVPDETFSSSNAKGAPRGRLIVMLIDQGNIRTGAARPAMTSAKKFIDTLTPEDRVAVMAVPSPGELVDFTTDHDKVREALLRITGAGDALKASHFNISITEALAVHMHSDFQRATEVIARECATAASTEIDRCQRDVEQDAAEIVGEVRRRTDNSVAAMRSLFKGLASVDGPKSVIYVSEGLVFEGLGSETDELGQAAADARASLDVLLLDVPRFDASQALLPTTPREDRDLQVSGLEMLAGAARGGLYRINTSADYAFDRISHSLDGYYLLGVEAKPDDKNGKRHRIGVKSTRRGVSIRSRRTFVTALSARAGTPADAVSQALRSPLPVNDLPLKIATWTYKDPGSSKIRVLVSAEVERLVDQSLDYTVGVVIANKDGRGLGQPVEVKKLAPKTGDDGAAVFSSMLTVDPGQYRVVVSMADSEGRVGSVSRGVTAFQMDGPGISVGDLMLGVASNTGNATIEPVIEPVITGPMAAMMEAYGTVTGVDAILEILSSDNSPPIAAVQMHVAAGRAQGIANISAQFNTSVLPPGRYLARGVITQQGKTQGHLIRPFRIAGAGAVAAPSAMPVEMTSVLMGALAAFDRKALLTPAAITSTLLAAESRPAGSKAAIKEARSGDLGGAAMTALGDGDQALAMFLKGLELYQGAQVDKAAMQFQNSMQAAPTFAPARLYFGAALAEANQHKEAAGLIQSAAMTPPNAGLAMLAGEEWLKAGQPQLAITPLELAVQQPSADPRAKKLLGVSYVFAGRPADALTVLTPYLDSHPADSTALLAAIYSAYTGQLAGPSPTLAADRTNVAKWSKAYTAAKAPLQSLVAAWAGYVQGLK